jgi:hypothetical protein
MKKQEFSCKLCGFKCDTETGFGLHMKNTHGIIYRVFSIKLPESELEAWQLKKKKAGYNTLSDFIRSAINNESQIELAKLSVKQDYDVKIEELARQNEKLKLQADTLIFVLNRYQKLTPEIREELERTNEKIIESGFTLEQWDRMCEEEAERENENKILDREWDKLSAEQKQKARWYMNARKQSLPDAIKSVSNKLSDDFKEAFK